MKKRKVAIIISLVLTFLAVMLIHFYLPYVKGNNIFDLHFPGTLMWWFAVPAISLFGWGVFYKGKLPGYIMATVIGLIIYKVLLSITFTYYDIVALFLCGIITYLIYRVLRISFFEKVEDDEGKTT